MVKNTETHDASEGRSFGLNQAMGALDLVFGGLPAMVWKTAIFYALWIGLAHTAMTNVAGENAAQMAAIGYWFGWLFLAMTVVVGLFVAVTSWTERRRVLSDRS